MRLPGCAEHDRSRFNQKENGYWNTDLAIVRFDKIRETAFRPWAAQHHSAPLLQRHRRGLGRPQARDPLRHRRGYRHDRRQLGRRVVRGRARPQLGLQAGMQDGAALIDQPFVLDMFPAGVLRACSVLVCSPDGVPDGFSPGRSRARRWLSAVRRWSGSLAWGQDRRQNQPGQFDFYVLALSWSPSFCEAAGERGTPPQQQCAARPYSFVVHGLWPQYEKRLSGVLPGSRRRGSTATSCPPCSI